MLYAASIPKKPSVAIRTTHALDDTRLIKNTRSAIAVLSEICKCIHCNSFIKLSLLLTNVTLVPWMHRAFINSYLGHNIGKIWSKK